MRVGHETLEVERSQGGAPESGAPPAASEVNRVRMVPMLPPPAAGDGPEAALRVVVLGMHRSGTSAMSRLVNLLGVPLGAEDDLMPPTEANPRGFWESRRLAEFNERLFGALAPGASWSAPPADCVEADSVEADRIEGDRVEGRKRGVLCDFAEEARCTFTDVYRKPSWVWKDPRLCLLLPFWAAALDAQPLVVLVYRSPVVVAASLARRDGLSRAHALALWERYVRSSLLVAAGRPTLVVSYESIVSDPTSAVDHLSDFLHAARPGSDVLDGRADGVHDAARLYLDSDLNRSPSTAMTERDCSFEQSRLIALLTSLDGAHTTFPEATLPPATPWAEPLLDSQRVLSRFLRLLPR